MCFFKSRFIHDDIKAWQKSKTCMHIISSINHNISWHFYHIFQQFYSYIASAIMPTASVIAVPSAARYFPIQKTSGQDEWGPFASTVLRASLTTQMLLPSPSVTSSRDDDEDSHQFNKQRSPIGRMDASTDEDRCYGNIFDHFNLKSFSYIVMMMKSNANVENQLLKLLLKAYENIKIDDED